MARQTGADGKRMMAGAGWALLVCTVLAAAPAHAIAPALSLAQLQHRSWTASQGMPASPTSLAQTEDGYLWIGTASGLYRFDGVRFEEYRPAKGSFPGSYVYALKAQAGGGLWIGWQQGGVSLLQNGVLSNFGENEGIGAGTVWGFAFDKSGALWAAGVNGVARFDRQGWRKMGPQQGYTAKKASAIFVDRDGQVGAFSEQGLFLWNAARGQFAPPIGKLDTRQPPQQAPDGKIYFLEKRGIRVIDSLARYDQLDQPWIYRDTSGDSGSMLVDRGGSLWLDGGTSGVHRVALDAPLKDGPNGLPANVESYTKKDGLSADLLSTLLEDREGNIWIATSGGLDRFRQVDVRQVNPGAADGQVAAARLLPGPDGSMWLARSRNESGWQRLAPDGGALAPAQAGAVDASARAPDGALWRALGGGLQRLAPDGSKRTIAYPADMGPVRTVHAVVLDGSNTPWLSVIGMGVFRYRDGGWEREPLLPDNGKRTPMSMLADARGRMWFGYANNTVAMLEAGRVSLYGAAQGLKLGRIAVLYEAGGKLWAAGQDGVAQFTGQGFVPWIILPDKAKNVSSMLADRAGALWLNTSNGPMVLPAAATRTAPQAAPIQGRLFDALDGVNGVAGLLNNQSLAQASDGKVWFSTREGTAWIDPQHLLTPATPPAVHIQALVAGGVRHVEPLRLALAAPVRDVQIDYTSALLSTPERLAFRYKLDGYDSDWQEAGSRRQAFYTGLAPGDYHLRVAAKNAGGDWGPEGPGLHFTVLPAFYQSWWFRTLGGAALLGVAWLFHRQRLRRAERQYTRHLRIRQAERDRIARELHDTLLQGIQAMILRFHVASTKVAPQDPARRLMEHALAQADGMLAEGRDRVHELRACDPAGAGIVETLRAEAGALAAENGLDFQFSEHGKARAIAPDSGDELYRIAMEAVTNAVRHAQARSLALDISYDAAALLVTVRDDGGGLPAHVRQSGAAPGHWGLPGMQERAERLRATLAIESPTTTGPGAGAGVRVHLRIPAKVAYVQAAPAWRRLLRLT